MEKTTKEFIWRMIKKTPEIIGVGIGMSLLSIGIPALILAILAPDYAVGSSSFLLRWACVCVVLTFAYYWSKEKNKE